MTTCDMPLGPRTGSKPAGSAEKAALRTPPRRGAASARDDHPSTRGPRQPGTVSGGAAPKLSWDLQQRAGKPVIVVSNAGDRRIRLSKLKFVDGRGGTADFGEGLAGYVLGHSTRIFAVPPSAKGFGGGGVVSISAQSDVGPIDLKR